MAGGRPSSFDPELCDSVAELCRAGATDLEVAEHLGIDRATLYRWKTKHPEFRDALKTAKEEADQRVEASLFHRATGYSHPAVKILSTRDGVVEVPFTEHYPPDTTAAIFWLKNRQPERWRDVNRTELTGKDGGALRIDNGPDLSKLTKEELRAWHALAVKAAGDAQPDS